MSDRMDDWLSHLPADPPRPDLTARITAAVARYRRDRAMWRHIGVWAFACALAGAACLVVSSPHVLASLTQALSALETNDASLLLNALANSPVETLAAWLDSGLIWQSAELEGIGIVFTLGVALLACAAFGELARMLRTGAPAPTAE